MKLGWLKVAAVVAVLGGAAVTWLLASVSTSAGLAWLALELGAALLACTAFVVRELRRTRRAVRRVESQTGRSRELLLADAAAARESAKVHGAKQQERVRWRLDRLATRLEKLSRSVDESRLSTAADDRVMVAVADCARAVAALSVKVDALALERATGRAER